MDYHDLEKLANQVIDRLRPLVKGTHTRLNPNFVKKTDSYTNGWHVQIGWITGWHPNCKLQIWLDDMCGWKKMQFQYCVQFREEDKMHQFLRKIDSERMFGKVVDTIRDTDNDRWKTVNGKWILTPPLPQDHYGKPISELNFEIGNGYFFYTINDLSEYVNDALVDRIVEFFAAMGKALAEKQNIDDPNLYSAMENRNQVKEHLTRERNSYLSLLRKQKDKYKCQICEMTFENVYGEIGKNFAEAHHIVPLAQLDGAQSVSVDDLITVCANCHRMLHKLQGESEDIEELKVMLLMHYKRGKDSV